MCARWDASANDPPILSADLPPICSLCGVKGWPMHRNPNDCSTPCLVCGAPILDGVGHDKYCAVGALGPCHSDCGPVTDILTDGSHAHTNIDGTCWHPDETDVSA